MVIQHTRYKPQYKRISCVISLSLIDRGVKAGIKNDKEQTIKSKIGTGSFGKGYSSI